MRIGLDGDFAPGTTHRPWNHRWFLQGLPVVVENHHFLARRFERHFFQPAFSSIGTPQIRKTIRKDAKRDIKTEQRKRQHHGESFQQSQTPPNRTSQTNAKASSQVNHTNKSYLNLGVHQSRVTPNELQKASKKVVYNFVIFPKGTFYCILLQHLGRHYFSEKVPNRF